MKSRRNAVVMRSLVGVAVFGALTMGFAAPSFAATPSGSSTIGAEAPSAPSSSSSEVAIDARLKALEGTQTQAQILAIVDSAKRVQALYDTVTNKYLAAYVEAPSASPQTIYPDGPGCALTDACAITTSNVHYGFYGTGSAVTINVPSVKNVYAGNVKTFWYYNNNTQVLYERANLSLSVTPATEMDSISRG
jgi:hypothetical protein